jgi:hypothetical protein
MSVGRYDQEAKQNDDKAHVWDYARDVCLRCGHAHYGDVDHGPCRECNGTGSVEEEFQPRTLDDLEQEDFDMLEAALRTKP